MEVFLEFVHKNMSLHGLVLGSVMKVDRGLDVALSRPNRSGPFRTTLRIAGRPYVPDKIVVARLVHQDNQLRIIIMNPRFEAAMSDIKDCFERDFPGGTATIEFVGGTES